MPRETSPGWQGGQPAGLPKTGSENFGGAIVTAGGLVFCTGTRDKKIRAFSAETGVELWAATAPPRHRTADDAWVAFALPKLK
jgi:glucose dehydrogenase